MKVVTAAEMIAADHGTIEEVGLPAAILMENAARAVAEVVRHRYPAETFRQVIVLCGPGNNGGDGYALARNLLAWGYVPRCLCFTAPEKLSGAAGLHYQAWERCQGVTSLVRDWETLPSSLSAGLLLVDCLFGTGLSRPLEGVWARAVDAVNKSGKPVLSVDLPSGLESDSGRILGCAVRAEITVTLGLPKRGLFFWPGRGVAGEVLTAEIGLAPHLLNSPDIKGALLEEEQVARLLPRRPLNSHKGTYGRCLVLGGSWHYSGAPVLAARAALRAGAGLVDLAVPISLESRLQCPQEVIMHWSPECEGAWCLPEEAPGKENQPWRISFNWKADSAGKVFCLGPGMGRARCTGHFVEAFLAERSQTPGVVDADALFFLAELGRTPGTDDAVHPWVLTPHWGEARRLLGQDSERPFYAKPIEDDVVGAAYALARHYSCVAVLKGAPTVICDGANYWINTSGGPALSQAGTGDVLAGLIAGLMAQGLTPLQAAVVGVWLHGRAGEALGAPCGNRGVCAAEVADAIPGVLGKILH